MADAKKVSFNQATAKSTERHNDRSMYKHGYEERSNNWHWDMYGCGSTFEAEARFYEDTFKPTLEAQNDKAIKMRKYDRVMNMKTWHKKHPPKECIVQLGDVENNDTSLEFAKGAAKKIERAIHRAGGIVLSIDLHDDERTIDEYGNEIKGTPHLHIRYVFVGENKDKNPVMDMKNVLLANGIQPPNPDKPISKTNNPAQTFLETTRTALEDYADQVELAHGNPRVNREREKRSHSSVQQYKLQKRVEELQKRVAELQRQEKEAIVTRDAALAEIAEKQREADAEVAESRQALASERLEVARGQEDNKREANRLNRLSGAVEASEMTSDARKDVLDEREAKVNARFNKLSNLIRYLEKLKREILDAVDWVKSADDDYERVVRAHEVIPKVMSKATKVTEATSKVVVKAPDEDEVKHDGIDYSM